MIRRVVDAYQRVALAYSAVRLALDALTEMNRTNDSQETGS
jgi:hypothetical protein